jgi:anti-sigma regulatory factor (Ser/Thr protein kinase)
MAEVRTIAATHEVSHIRLVGRLDIEGVGTIEIPLTAATVARKRPAIVDMSDDDGRPFDPNSAQPVPVPTSLDDAPTGGMGLSLVRNIAGPVEYQRLDSRNRARLRIAI